MCDPREKSEANCGPSKRPVRQTCLGEATRALIEAEAFCFDVVDSLFRLLFRVLKLHYGVIDPTL